MDAAVNVLSRNTWLRAPSGRNDDAQTIVIKVRPNDNPKTAGLRNESGPSPEPPPITRIPRWITPLVRSSTPTR